MAAGNSDYTHGEMEVTAQEGTFKGFMGMTMYGGALVALIVIMPTLVYGVGLSWPLALIATLIVGIIIGIAMKLKAQWYASIIGLGILTAIFCGLLSFFFG